MDFDSKKFVPLNGTILVVDDEKAEKVGGIYVPENAEGEHMLYGTVLATSPFMLQDGKYCDPEMEYNDRVIYSMHAGAGNVIESDKKIYRIIRHNEILGKILLAEVAKK